MANAMTVQDVRDFVRLYFDLDSTDLPDKLVDRWISEGWGKVVRYRPNWPGFNATVQLTTLALVSEYASPLKDIESISGPDRFLLQLSASNAERRFIRSGVEDPAGTPVAFSVYAGKVRLWPKPAIAGVYAVRGQRTPLNPTDSIPTDPIDLPSPDAVEMLTAWVLARVATREQELETAKAYSDAFSQGMQLLAKDETDSPAFVPIVLNSQRPLPVGSDSYLPDRLRFDDGWDR